MINRCGIVKLNFGHSINDIEQVFARNFCLYQSLVIVHSSANGHKTDNNSKKASKDISWSVGPASEVIMNFVLNELRANKEGV
jgi:hypothetical protein